MNIKIKKKTLQLLLAGFLIFTAAFFLLNSTIFSPLLSPQQLQNGNLLTIFLTGLFAGALTCLAVQGGLLATSIAQREEEKLKDNTKRSGNAFPIFSFLVAKLFAYTVLGLLLGWFGSFFQLSLTANIVLQLAVGVFMLGTALNLLDAHPVFRYFIIQPPRFLTRMVRNQSKSSDFFGPAFLGAFTVFIPCGTTQAMMALAIASGNPLTGAAILFAFVLGTVPLFFLLGYFATRLGDAMQQKFMKFAAFALIILVVFNLNNTLALSGSAVTLESIWQSTACRLGFCNTPGDSVLTTSGSTGIEVRPESNAQNNVGEPVSETTIQFQDTAYSPNAITVKAGSEVKLTLVNKNAYTCVQAFTIPKLNIQRIVPAGKSDVVIFTAPDTPGQLAFMCGMGMYRGMIHII